MKELVALQGENIVITVPIAALTVAALIAWDRHYGQHSMVVTDLAAFAKEFVLELKRESEDGTTIVHLMLDKAAVNAAEGGSEGIGEVSPDR